MAKDNDITRSYKDYTITFDESTENWSCAELNITNPSLTKVRARIEALTKVDRKVNVQAIRIVEKYSDEKRSLEDVTVTIFCEDRYPGAAEECWITTSRKTREKIAVKQLYPASQREALQAYCDAANSANAAAKAARDMRDRITHYTIAKLQTDKPKVAS